MSAIGSDFEELVSDIADGKEVDLSVLAPGAGSHGLARLQALTRAFRNIPVSEAADPRPTLFQWRHLAVKKPIGAGSFGQIFRAYDPALRRDVALKVSKGQASREAVGKVVVTEARRMARLRHPNILAVHGADEHDGKVGIWSDLIDGTTLEALLASKGQLSPEESLRLAIPLADALQLIHHRALTHGDFKAANVMVQPDGSPVVMDFGSSRDMTGGAATVGSPLIMAPEFFDDGVGTAATDVYAFGVMLFQMLSGQYPVRAATVDELLQKHLDAEPVRFDLLPRSWRRLISSMLSADWQQRPDAQSVCAQLDVMRTAKQRLLKRVAVAAIVGSLTLGLIVSALAYREAIRERDRAESTTAALIDILQSPRPSRSGRALRVLDLLRDFKPQLEQMLVDQPESRARLLIEIAKTFLYFDDFDSAQQLSDQALQACSGCAEIELAMVTIDHHHILGEIELSKLRMTQAEQHARSALATAEQHFPADSVQRVYALASVGKVLNAQRRVDEAEPYLVEAMQRGAALTWSNKAQWASVRGHRLNNLIAQEDYPLAEPMARELAKWTESTLGMRHGTTLSARQSLSRILIRIGKIDEAQERLLSDIELASDWLGGTDATTLGMRAQMALLVGKQGRLQESITQLERIRSDVLADVEPDQEVLLVVSGNLASRYKENQQLVLAENLYNFVIERATKTLGAEHGRTLLNRVNLSELYLMREQYAEALRTSIDVERVAGLTLGEGSAITNFARLIQGRSLVAGDNWAAGLPKLEQAASQFLEHLGPTASLTMDAQLYLAKALSDTGERERALSLIEELLQRSEATRGLDHQSTREIAALRDVLTSKGATD